MRKKLILISKITGALGLLFFITATIITLSVASRVKEIVVSELNKQLATEVKVNGDVTFSLFRNFPYASLNFNDVEMKETLPEKNDLLTCQTFSFLFNIWDVLGHQYKIVKVIASNGNLNVRINSSGITNYDIFKTDTTKPESFSLTVERAELDKITIGFDDERTNQHYLFETRQTFLSGNFAASSFVMKIKSDLLSKQLLVGGIDYLHEKNASLNCELAVDLGKDQYTFNNGTINIEGNDFAVSGDVLSKEEGNELNLKISSDKLQLQDVAGILPKEYSGYISHYKSYGRFNFTCSLTGVLSAKDNPAISAQFTIEDGKLYHTEMKSSFEHVNLKGQFSNGAAHAFETCSMQFAPFTTTFEGNDLSGALLISNFNHPLLDISLDGKLLLENIAPLFENDFVKKMSGTVSFQQCFYKGDANQLSTSIDLNKIEAGGNFTMENVSLETPQVNYKNINGDFALANNKIEFHRASFTAGKSDLTFSGTLLNLFPYLLASLRDSVANPQKIGTNLKIRSTHLSWEDVFGNKEPTTKKTVPAATEDYFSLPSIFYLLKGSIAGSLDDFTYDKFHAKQFTGAIHFLGDDIFFDNISLNAEEGTLTGNGKLNIADPHKSFLNLAVKLNHLDITQLFYEFSNFGQSTLTSENLKGFITSTIALNSTWNARKLNKDALYAVADITVENGELNNFEPMMALATFVKMNELKSIHFSKMQNQVEIKQQKIYIPAMQIFSNALNVQLSGTHGFDNIIDYKVQVNLLELLTSKFKKTNFEPEGSDETTDGLLNLYITMTGPVDDPIIKYDNKTVKEKISESIKEEGNTLKDVLQKEFNKEERDQQEVKDWKAPDQFEEMQFEEDSIQEQIPVEDDSISSTKKDQKNQFQNFKNKLKPKSPPKQ